MIPRTRLLFFLLFVPLSDLFGEGKVLPILRAVKSAFFPCRRNFWSNLPLVPDVFRSVFKILERLLTPLRFTLLGWFRGCYLSDLFPTPPFSLIMSPPCFRYRVFLIDFARQTFRHFRFVFFCFALLSPTFSVTFHIYLLSGVLDF